MKQGRNRWRLPGEGEGGGGKEKKEKVTGANVEEKKLYQSFRVQNGSRCFVPGI